MATSNKPWDEDQVIATASTEENGAEETAPETNYNDAVQELYIAYYGRPADPSGLAYWVEQAEAAGGVEGIIGDFTTSAESDEFVQTGQPNLDWLNATYAQVFGASPAPANVAVWLEQLDDGAERGSLIPSMLEAGKSNANQSETLAHKLQAANTFTAVVEASGQSYTAGQIRDVQALLATINRNTSEEDMAGLEAAYTALVATFPTLVDEAEIALTADNDSILAGSQNTQFTAYIDGSDRTLHAQDRIDGNGGDNTLTLNQTNGSFDGFNEGGYLRNVQTIEINQDSNPFNFDATGIVGTNTFVLRALGENTQVGSLTSLSLLNAGSDSITVDTQDLQQAALRLSFSALSAAQQDLIRNPVVGEEQELVTSLDLLLNNTGVAADVAAATEGLDALRPVVTVERGYHDTMHLNVTGENTLQLQAAQGGYTGAGDLRITGEGNLNLTLGNAYTAIETVNAGDASGNLTLDLRAQLLEHVELGSGDDRLIVNLGNLDPEVNLDGGSGQDTLVLTQASGTTQPIATNFQTLEIQNVNAGTTLAAQGMADLETVRFSNNSLNTGDRLTIANGPDNLTTEFVGQQSAVGADGVVSTSEGVATVNVEAGANALASNTTQAAAQNTSVRFNATEADNLVVNAKAYSNTATTASFSAANAGSVTLNVERSLNAANEEQTLFAGGVNAVAADDFTVNANGKLNNAALDVRSATSGEINVGDIRTVTGGDLVADTHTLRVDARSLTELDIVARGNLTLNGLTGVPARDLRNLEDLDITSFRHTDMSAFDLESIQDVTLSGDRENSQVTLGNLGRAIAATGDADADENVATDTITVTATGLDDGLVIGTITTGFTGGAAVIDRYNSVGSVELDIAGVSAREGDVGVGNISAASISVNASDNSGALRAENLTLGTLTATGSISPTNAVERATIDLQFANAVIRDSGVLGDLEIGNVTMGRAGVGAIDPSSGGFLGTVAIQGGNFTLNAENLQGNLEVGTITYNSIASDTVVDINAQGAAGEVDLGNITLTHNTSTQNAQGDYVAAAGALGGTVKINLNGVVEDVNIGTITASVVEITANQLLGEVTDKATSTANTWGNITADVVTFKGTQLNSNIITMNVSESAHIEGGIEDDTITVNATGSSLTLTGTLGLGDTNQMLTVNIPTASFDADTGEFGVNFNVRGSGENNDVMFVATGGAATDIIKLSATSQLIGFEDLTVTNGTLDATALGVAGLGQITGTITLNSGLTVTARQLEKLVAADFAGNGAGLTVIIDSAADVTRLQEFLNNTADSTFDVSNVDFVLTENTSNEVRTALLAVEDEGTNSPAVGNIDDSALPEDFYAKAVNAVDTLGTKATATIDLGADFEPVEGNLYTFTVDTTVFTHTALKGETIESLVAALRNHDDYADAPFTLKHEVVDGKDTLAIDWKEEAATGLTAATDITFKDSGTLDLNAGANGTFVEGTDTAYENSVTFDLAATANWNGGVPGVGTLEGATFTLTSTAADGTLTSVFTATVNEAVTADADTLSFTDLSTVGLAEIAAAMANNASITASGTEITLTGVTAEQWTAELTVDLA